MDLAAINIQQSIGDPSIAAVGPSTGPKSEAEMRAVALRFETVFLAEMLKHTGVGELREGFNGGAGEAAFSGLLTWEYAEEMAQRGTIGLADKVYSVLRERVQP